MLALHAVLTIQIRCGVAASVVAIHGHTSAVPMVFDLQDHWNGLDLERYSDDNITLGVHDLRNWGPHPASIEDVPLTLTGNGVEFGHSAYFFFACHFIEHQVLLSLDWTEDSVRNQLNVHCASHSRRKDSAASLS